MTKLLMEAKQLEDVRSYLHGAMNELTSLRDKVANAERQFQSSQFPQRVSSSSHAPSSRRPAPVAARDQA